MKINWKSLIPFVVPFLLLLVAVHNTPQVQNYVYDSAIDNSYTTLEKNNPVHFSKVLDSAYLGVNAFQPDTLKYQNFPYEIKYGDQLSLKLIIDGIGEYRVIKVLVTDPNNIVRFSDSNTANYINSNLNNESIFKTDSQQISIKKRIIINLNVPPSNSELIEGDWKFNIIILNDEGDTSLFVSKSVNISDKKSSSNTPPLLQLILFAILMSLVAARIIYKLS